MKTIIRFLGISLLVAVGGIIFATIFGTLVNGLEYGVSMVLGIGVYLCIVVTVCTGVIISKIQK